MAVDSVAMDKKRQRQEARERLALRGLFDGHVVDIPDTPVDIEVYGGALPHNLVIVTVCGLQRPFAGNDLKSSWVPIGPASKDSRLEFVVGAVAEIVGDWYASKASVVQDFCELKPFHHNGEETQEARVSAKKEEDCRAVPQSIIEALDVGTLVRRLHVAAPEIQAEILERLNRVSHIGVPCHDTVEYSR